MIPISSNARIWIATGHTDMRKGMQGLSLLVQEGLGRDPFAGDVFVFRGRGGSLPEHQIPTVLLSITGPASRLAAALRRGEPPVIARIEKDQCCLDPRTVLKGEDEILIDAVEAAAKSVG